MYRLVCLAACIGLISCAQDVYNTTAAATNIESTLGTPAILVDPTSISNQNTTDTVLEVGIFVCSFFLMLWGWQLTRKKLISVCLYGQTILRITPLSNSTNEPDGTTIATTTTRAPAFAFDIDLTALIERMQTKNTTEAPGQKNFFQFRLNNFIFTALLIGNFIIQSKDAYRVVCGTVYSAWKKTNQTLKHLSFHFACGRAILFMMRWQRTYFRLNN